MCRGRGHICTPILGFRAVSAVSPGAMAEKDHPDDEQTPEDLLEAEMVTPQEEVEIPPEWEEHPEEQPGENTRIEDGELRWESDGFDVRLWNLEPTKWKAVISIPTEVGGVWAREMDIKCRPMPHYGFVDSAVVEDYKVREVTLILSENFQPVHEVNAYIESLREDAETFQERQQEWAEKIAEARSVEFDAATEE